MLQVACVVEGHGEVPAVPVLVRRIAQELDPALPIHVPPPLRVPRYKLVKPGELERAAEFSARKTSRQGALLVLVDAEDDCPAQLGPDLRRRANAAIGNLPVGVVLAKREFENWFLAAAESIAGRRNLPAALVSPADPEAVRGAKEWLTRQMPGNASYQETLDQPALTAVFDMALARLRSPSFDKCYRVISQLLEALRARGGPPSQ
jgi:hypothetical protein